MNYLESGVDIHTGELLVNRIKNKVRNTYTKRVYEGVGGFASLYEISEDKLIAAGCDGVGTKIKLAIDLNIHNTIGQDLVAMCVNDVLCTGATPLFFLDYLATSQLKLDLHESVISGIADACKQSNIALIGGETAEMPGMYQLDDYDLAGFCIGELKKEEIMLPSHVKAGDTLIGLTSSGFHSNGYSLLRKLVKDHEIDLKKELLTPTKIYTNIISKLYKHDREAIHGVAHITGGGIDNIKRMNSKLNYNFDSLPDYNTSEFKQRVSPLFSEIAQRANLDDKELYKTFNMGIGMVLATDRPDKIGSFLSKMNEDFFIIGRVED